MHVKTGQDCVADRIKNTPPRHPLACARGDVGVFPVGAQGLDGQPGLAGGRRGA